MALNLRTQKLIYVAVIVVIILVAIFFGYDQYQKAAAKWSTAQAARQEVTNLKQEVADLQQLNAELQKSETAVAAVEKALPPGLAMPELLTNLEAIAVKSEMTFNSVDVAGGKSKTGVTAKTTVAAATSQIPGLQEIPVTVSVTGGYANLKVYLDSLEHNLRLVDVQSIAMEAAGTYTITLKAYYVD